MAALSLEVHAYLTAKGGRLRTPSPASAAPSDAPRDPLGYICPTFHPNILLAPLEAVRLWGNPCPPSDGKHPLGKGFNQPQNLFSTSERVFWQAIIQCGANVGLWLEGGRLAVIDCDSAPAFEAVRAYVLTQGLPYFGVLSGRDGTGRKGHIYFRTKTPLKNATRLDLPAVGLTNAGELWAHKHFLVLPPSRHKSGVSYEVDPLSTSPSPDYWPAPAIKALLGAAYQPLTTPATASLPPSDFLEDDYAPCPVGTRHNTLKARLCSAWGRGDKKAFDGALDAARRDGLTADEIAKLEAWVKRKLTKGAGRDARKDCDNATLSAMCILVQGRALAVWQALIGEAYRLNRLQFAMSGRVLEGKSGVSHKKIKPIITKLARLGMLEVVTNGKAHGAGRGVSAVYRLTPFEVPNIQSVTAWAAAWDITPQATLRRLKALEGAGQACQHGKLWQVQPPPAPSEGRAPYDVIARADALLSAALGLPHGAVFEAFFLELLGGENGRRLSPYPSCL